MVKPGRGMAGRKQRGDPRRSGPGSRGGKAQSGGSKCDPVIRGLERPGAHAEYVPLHDLPLELRCHTRFFSASFETKPKNNPSVPSASTMNGAKSRNGL